MEALWCGVRGLRASKGLVVYFLFFLLALTSFRFELRLEREFFLGKIGKYGTGAFVLKEKLKRIKACLRTWNSEVFGDIQRNSKEILRKIQSLDEKLEEVGLSMEEQNQRRTWQAEYWRLAKSNESLLQQKSRCNWIREGDSNTKFFHSFMNWRRNANSVLGMEIDGVWINDPVLVKNGAKDFFEGKFSRGDRLSLSLDGVPFRQISAADNTSLIAEFDPMEVREAVWQCGSDKSPGPDGMNF
ncbi:uncharacterized protein LOC130739795 [Lotus japonicus]|uniref:uncharacterized protein LOC130739795 n=1 Tax=Lotus japonicus TaxID=34305 RepID=UPI00258341CE|nr:uncharacterized protein LOC130739795 [Lotus japonicus]